MTSRKPETPPAPFSEPDAFCGAEALNAAAPAEPPKACAGPAPGGEVLVRIPRLRDGGDEQQFVAVNGRTFLIRRGEEVRVPDCVAEVLRHSAEAFDRADEFVERNAVGRAPARRR